MPTVASAHDALPRAATEVRFWRCADERDQALAVVEDIRRLLADEHVEPRLVAVALPRIGTEARMIAGALEERAIPHRLQGAAAIAARAETRDVIAWLRILVDRGDAGAATRALLRPPVELRHVDIAQVIQIARRRRLDIVAALPAAIESPQVPPEACERIHRFLTLHADLLSALRQMPPQAFIACLLQRLGLNRLNPVVAADQASDHAATIAWLEDAARAFERASPASRAAGLAAHIIDVAGNAEATGVGTAQALAAEENVVRLLTLMRGCAPGAEHVYLVGLQAGRIGPAGGVGVGGPVRTGSGADRGQARSDQAGAIDELLSRGCKSVVLCYARAAQGQQECVPLAAVERVRDARNAQWQDMAGGPADPEEAIEAALRTMRQELLDGVASIGGRLGELRLDTEVDVSHGIVRYLELVKLAALLERAPDQSVAEALADVNARLLTAVTPLQREILESSTLDEELLAGRAGPGYAGRGLGGSGTGEPSLQRFLPRKGDGLLLSASDVETYRGCPLRYKFMRVLRIPSEPTRNQRFGIVVHQTLERYHASGAKTLPQLLSLFESSWRRSGFGDGEQDRALRAKATAALQRYHERIDAEEPSPVWFERSFSFQLGPHHVRGRVDRVDRLADGSYELIDYKTGRPRSDQELREDIQLSLYALAARESWQLQSSRQSYYYLLDDVKVPLPADASSAQWVRGAVLDVAEAIIAQRFEPTPSRAACRLCDYRIACPVAES